MKILFKPQPKHHHHHHIWKSLYFYISMDFPIYLPTTKVYVKTFCLKKFGQIFSCLPYLPFQKFWTFWKESLLLNLYPHGMYWGIMKILIIREAFKLRLSLRMNLNNEHFLKPQPKHHHHQNICKSLYFYISMDFPIYLPTRKVYVRTFFF